MDKRRIREREVIDKPLMILRYWNYFQTEKIENIEQIPANKLANLMSLPFVAIVTILANHKRISSGWGWRDIRDEFGLSAYEAQKICGLRVPDKKL